MTKAFGNIAAVDDLSFSVMPGTVTGFLGPNGAGKTTTLRILLGLTRPTSGIALVHGAPFSSLPEPGRVVGAVLESQSLHPSRTALNHLRLYTAAMGLPDDRAHAALQLVGLGTAANQKAGTFSLGMRQRLALATALLGDPAVLVLDEPANGLDPEGIAWLRDFLQSFARTGRTVLISSHLLKELEHTVDHVVIVNRGSLVYSGAMASLRAHQQTRTLVACSDPAALVAALASAGYTHPTHLADGRIAVVGASREAIAAVAQPTGVTLFGIVDETADLEQIFLAMTHGQYTANPVPSQYYPAQTYPTQTYPTQMYPPQPYGAPPPMQYPPGPEPVHYPTEQYPQQPPQGWGGPQ